MATPNEPNVNGTVRSPPTETRAPSDRRADIGPRKVGLWAIVIGALVLGIVLAALDFAGRAEREGQDDRERRSVTPTPAGS
jgi:hypothetical protein